MATSRQMMAERVNALLDTIKRNPDGTSIITLRNRFAVIHGVSPEVVDRYLNRLIDGEFADENDGKIYPSGD